MGSCDGKVAAIACDLIDGGARSDVIERASEPIGPVDMDLLGDAFLEAGVEAVA